MAAEIQLTRLGDIPMALAGYTAVLDSFPETPAAPKAAYAIAWIRQNKLGEKEAAVERYRALVERYPRSFQAKGALYQLELAGADSLAAHLQAYRDSALADTIAAPRAAPAAPVSPDTAGVAREKPGALTTPADTLTPARQGGAG
jgi:tetratricopeptide (TPR) repeat protein